MDDVVYVANREVKLHILKEIFRALQVTGITHEPSTVQFVPKDVKCLGHFLPAGGIHIDDDRINADIKLQLPKRLAS